MENRKILFTAPGKAELVPCEMPRIAPDEVLIETDYTAISAGTERANLLDMPNVTHQWPKHLGYSGSGRIVEVGTTVKNFRVGQRVLMDHLGHCAYAKARFQVNGDGFYPVPEDVDPLEAAFVVVGSMGVQGARKTRLQMGEAAMVTGLGILGLFAVQSMVRMGATPLIAVDFAEDRRRVALELGADYALAPDAHFVEAVRELTEADVPIDFYTLVHKPGVQLIGAHNHVRPAADSYWGYWTRHDDFAAMLRMMRMGKMRVRPMISGVFAPEQAPEVFRELGENACVPLGRAFDWHKSDGRETI